jgi:hypothetical protein
MVDVNDNHRILLMSRHKDLSKQLVKVCIARKGDSSILDSQVKSLLRETFVCLLWVPSLRARQMGSWHENRREPCFREIF